MAAPPSSSLRKQQQHTCHHHLSLACSVLIFLAILGVFVTLCGFFAHLNGVYKVKYKDNSASKEYGRTAYQLVCVNQTFDGHAMEKLYADCQRWMDISNMDVNIQTMEDVFADIKSHFTICSDSSCSWFIQKAVDALINSFVWLFLAVCAVIVALAWKCGPVFAAKRLVRAKAKDTLSKAMHEAIPQDTDRYVELLDGVIEKARALSSTIDILKLKHD